MTALTHRSAIILGALALGIPTLTPPTARAAEKPHVMARAAVTDSVTFSVYLPLQHKDALGALLAAQQDPKSPSYRKWLKPQEFAKRFGPDAKTVEMVKKELTDAGLTVALLGSRQLQVSGPAALVERLLQTSLNKGTYQNGKTAYVLNAAPTLPAAMRRADAKVTGLSGMIRMEPLAKRSQITPENRYSPVGSYWFDDLKQAYKFPSYGALTGNGAHIGVLMSGGYSQADMDLYFGHEKLKSPKFDEVAVDGGSPFDPANDGTFEAELDLQQSGGMAPGAEVTLYSIPDLSDVNIVAGLLRAVEDDYVDMISMSFGAPEVYYTAAWNGGMDYTYLLQIEHEIYMQGNAQGITFIASSGDYGAIPAAPVACFEGVTGNCGKFTLSASAPASDPNVTAVGGTDLVTTYRPGDRESQYIRESEFADPLYPLQVLKNNYATNGVWASGGGSSVVFPQPWYQTYVKTGDTKARTVPDLSLHMGGCPANIAISCQPDDSSDLEVLGGEYYGVIGTSASAPDFAGLTALTIEEFGTRLGNVNPYIYTLAAAQASGTLPFKIFNQGIKGDNGYYHTTPTGYNRVLGNGSVNGANFLLAPQLPLAGLPQTPSNP